MVVVTGLDFQKMFKKNIKEKLNSSEFRYFKTAEGNL